MSEIDTEKNELNSENTSIPIKEKLQIPYAVLCELTHRLSLIHI